jgi:hypothetical protein
VVLPCRTFDTRVRTITAEVYIQEIPASVRAAVE